MIDRSLYYWSKLYSNSLYKTQDYIENKKTIVIDIMLFNIFEEGPYHERCKIRRDYNLEILTDELEMHFIQLPKCKKEEVKTKLDQWMQFIGNLSKEGVEIAMKENKEIKKAQEELEYLTGDEAERRLAFLREKKILDDLWWKTGERREIAKKMLMKGTDVDFIQEVTGLTKKQLEKIPEYAEREDLQRLAELREKWDIDERSALASAKDEGIEEGMKEGRKEGERNKSLEIAKNMLKKGLEVELIESVTGLTKEEIEKLS